jgi:hypothetical protein
VIFISEPISWDEQLRLHEYRKIEKFLQGFLKNIFLPNKKKNPGLSTWVLNLQRLLIRLEVETSLERNTAHSEVA